MWIKAKALYEIMPKQYKWIEGIIERLKKCENIDEFQTIIEELIQQIQKKSDQCDLVRLLNGANLKTLRCQVSYMILFSGLLTFEITIKLLEKILWANPSAESIEFTLGGPISTIKVDRDNQMRDLLPIKLILQGAIINYHEQWKSSDFPNEEEKLIITRKEDTATANPHKKLKRTEEEEWSIGLFDRTATSS